MPFWYIICSRDYMKTKHEIELHADRRFINQPTIIKGLWSIIEGHKFDKIVNIIKKMESKMRKSECDDRKIEDSPLCIEISKINKYEITSMYVGHSAPKKQCELEPGVTSTFYNPYYKIFGAVEIECWKNKPKIWFWDEKKYGHPGDYAL